MNDTEMAHGIAARGCIGYNVSLFFTALPASMPLRCESARLQRIPMQEINPINHLIKDLSERTDVLRGYL
ncbi:hypothetical protein C8E00_107106 [Chromohalobacter marismortui]|uniref:Uncharacterized protein n=1 Tax=Chromohalobacter marismortui TaxID=42055 RepID=A0A4R7NID5_9GAMM|nr:MULTISPECIES: hypothetical protein [Chromohalobacter]MCI0510860.1 hypothetical protein [Chromohalobacter sp.]MCI0592674.1 hypothetical protein [Chromohalobacter sp.]TDU20207.1 hypothetical protein C8E00_107106 [Chromohalobacter marismortui]